ncbi:MAG: HmuY family protein [Bacteroidota bacterium]
MKAIHYLNRLASLFTLVVLGAFISACSDDDPPLPDNLAAFESTELGMTYSETELEIKIQLSRAVDENATLSVLFTTEGVEYGTDFATEPAATGGTLSLTIEKGEEEASFKIIKASGLLLDGDEKITFTISEATEPVLVGEQKELVLSFAEILSAGALMEINGGGATYSNKVFIDLSANRQTAVLRTAWDLGFHMGEDFRVIVNSSTAMMARALDKTDLNAVTANDTVGFKNEMSLSAFNPDATAWIDDPTGDLTKTAIAAISATTSENKVYIINRGNGVGSPAPARGWKKIRIVRNASGGYTLQHADIAATSFSEIQIAKDDAYRFKYIHFENGAVDVEPAKDRWDIAWTYFTNTLNSGGSVIPYGYQDMILQNLHGVQTAKVLTSTKSYDSFAESDIASLTFSSSQIGIGSDWRRTSPSPAIVYDDRFYVIKDAGDNYYKARFTAILKDGVRGTPQFEFLLIKKGS